MQQFNFNTQMDQAKLDREDKKSKADKKDPEEGLVDASMRDEAKTHQPQPHQDSKAAKTYDDLKN